MQSAQPTLKGSRPKAIALLSGGLDSALATKLVLDQGVEVIGLHLVTPFGCETTVKEVAESLSIPLIFKDKGEAFLDLVENPRYGYGKNMNPCIDCRIFMFQLADVVRQDENADFIITGEVIGQRPMSQNRQSMGLIDRNSPIEGLVVRPLSAKSFAPSIPEEMGWVDREKLFRITGRGRSEQIELAKSIGVTEFASPGGGCLLTESAFSKRLKDFYDRKTHSTTEQKMAQAKTLRLGRHFRITDKFKVIVARNDQENYLLEDLWKPSGGIYFNPTNFLGPVAVGYGELTGSLQATVGALLSRYGKSHTAEKPEIKVSSEKYNSVFPIDTFLSDEEIERMRL